MTMIDIEVFPQLVKALKDLKAQAQRIQAHTAGNMDINLISNYLTQSARADRLSRQADQQITVNPTAAMQSSALNGGPETPEAFQAAAEAINNTAAAFGAFVQVQFAAGPPIGRIASVPNDLGGTTRQYIAPSVLAEEQAIAIAASPELQAMIDALDAAGV